jgi:ATP-dependent Clp protease ATP-binding subunit ClpC
MLLQVMEEGRLTDSFGRNVDFRNVVLIMTTNAGAEAIKNESHFGFQTQGDDASYESMKARVMDQVEKVFRPEFLNRLDEVIIFRHLTKENLHEVIDLEIAKVRERLTERGYDLVLTEASKELLIRKGTHLDMGARPLRRAIENHVEDPLAEELLCGAFDGMDTVVVDGIRDDNDKVVRLIFRGEQRHEIAEPETPEPVIAADALEKKSESDEG